MGVVSNEPSVHTNNAMLDFQPLNFYLIKNVEDIVVFLGLKVINSDNFYMFPI